MNSTKINLNMLLIVFEKMNNYILWPIFWNVEYKQLEIRKCLKKKKTYVNVLLLHKSINENLKDYVKNLAAEWF